MNTNREGFFSWTSRRIVLPKASQHDEKPYGTIDPTVDCRPIRDRPDIRLLVFYDDSDDSEYDAVTVGDTYGAGDVPIITPTQECLLVAAARPSPGPTVLLGGPMGDEPGLRPRDVVSQVLRGGPLLRLLRYTGVLSVVVPCAAPR